MARARARIAPALAYPMAVRRVLYTTNAIESLNSALRAATMATLVPAKSRK